VSKLGQAQRLGNVPAIMPIVVVANRKHIAMVANCHADVVQEVEDVALGQEVEKGGLVVEAGLVVGMMEVS
jgi:cystathionine beta-lyase family protein involved in aluminum resistance